jgi:hypothetical protein
VSHVVNRLNIYLWIHLVLEPGWLLPPWAPLGLTIDWIFTCESTLSLNLNDNCHVGTMWLKNRLNLHLWIHLVLEPGWLLPPLAPFGWTIDWIFTCESTLPLNLVVKQ